MALNLYFDPYHQEPDSVAPIVESNATKLDTPTLSLTATGQTTMSAVIGDVEQADGFIVQLSTVSNFASIAQSLYTESLNPTFSGLIANQLYYGRVTAIASGFINSNYGTDSEQTQGAPNQPPVVDAGNNTSVNLPTASIALNGTATDQDGSVASVLWTKVSGDASITISNNTSLNATLNNPNGVSGAVVVQLTATDNNGLSASDTVTKTWNYVNPQVSAGADVNITLPTNSGTLTATTTPGSYPIASTVWSKVSGAGTINADGTYSGLTQGTTVARVTVTDTRNVTAQDDVDINVAAAPTNIQWGYFNASPVGNLENLSFQFNKNVTAGVNTYTLDFTSAVFSGDKYLVIKEPATEPAKTSWFNTALNSEPTGSMPGFVYSVTVINGSRYYYTNDVAAVDSSRSSIDYAV